MNLKNDIDNIKDLVLHFNADLTSFTTFRLQSNGDLALVKSVSALSELLKVLESYGRTYRVIGWGANQVLRTVEKDFLIKLDFSFNSQIFDSPHSSYSLPSSVGLNILTAHALKFNLSGWEVFTGVPASLGGAIAMNAGTALGEIGGLIKTVKIMNSQGVIRTEYIGSESFGYRKNNFIKSGDIIIEAEIVHKGIDPQITQKIKDYILYRKASQPLASKNCGCVFKNYDQFYKAGKFIDLTGLKGLSVGALCISGMHANFMENKGNANYQDFYELIRIINQQMQLHWGIEFELEVKAV